MRRDFERDKAICAAATAGPWYIAMGSGEHLCTAVFSGEDDEAHNYLIADCLPDWALEKHYAPPDHTPNMEFIVEAREGWPAALEEIDHLQKALGKAIMVELRRAFPNISDEEILRIVEEVRCTMKQ